MKGPAPIARDETLDAQLAESERRFETLLQNLAGMAYRCANDRDWTVSFVSQGCVDLTGYRPEELIGNRVVSYGSLIHPDDADRVWREVQSALADGRPFKLEYRIRDRNGDEKWVWEQGVGVRDGRGDVEALEGIVHDVTERHAATEAHESMEQQMRAAQRMEAVGRLAGGIAHDFNNMLSVIMTFTELLRDQLGEGDAGREDAGEILAAANRAAGLTQQLLAFSRRQVQQLEIVSLNDMVTEMDRMLRRIIGEDVALVTRLAGDLGAAKVDVSQMEQVLMNLAVNARDAMPEGGKLFLETANVELDEGYGPDKGVKVAPGEYVMLAVTDTGTGMDEETRARIFEPFFTTKEAGKGTGLGLSTVYGIVKQSEGYVWVYSEIGRGTTFKIYLPRVHEEAAWQRPDEPQRDLSGSETVLLVEDDEPVRRAAARVLRGGGYDVLEADSGGQAIMLTEQHAGGIDLMITDVVMPDMGGQELVKRLRRSKGPMRVLYASGYTDHAVLAESMLDDEAAFLQKPFTSHKLLSKVREVLDQDGDPG